MKDQLNRRLTIKSTPKRVVSLVPSQTELLVDLGLQSSIVGVTKFCVHPKDLRKNKSVVGGTKQVDFNKIKLLNPDIILCNKEENTKDMILELEKIAPVHISDIYNIKHALELIRMYGDLFLVVEEASSIITVIKKECRDFSDFIQDKPKLKVAYFIWKNPWMVAASLTFIDDMLKLNKYKNYFEHLKRYPEVDMSIITKELDVILLSSEPYPFKSEHIDELKNQFPNTKVVLVDGEYFSWYGSKLQYAFQYFKTLRLNLLH